MANRNVDGEIVVGINQPESLKIINQDLDKILSQINDLEAKISHTKLDKSAIEELQKQIESLKPTINVSNVKINQNQAIKEARQTGQQIRDTVNRSIENSIKKTNNTLKSFSELKIGTGNIEAIFDENGIIDIEQSLNNIKRLYSDFGQVKITDKIFDAEGNIQKFKVNIEQVNGELKETRNFIMALNGTSFAFPDDVIKGSESIVQHLDKTKNVINQTGQAINDFANKAKIDEIQLLSNGGIKNDYSTQLAKLEGNFRNLGFTEDEAHAKISNVIKAFDSLKAKVNQPFDENNFKEIISLNDNLQKELIESTNEYIKLQSSSKGFVSIQQRLSKANTIEAWNQKNSAATKEVISANEVYIASLRDLNSEMSKAQFNKIADEFKKTENSMRSLGKLGASFKEQISQAAQSFTQWLSVSSAVMLVISKTRNAISELKEINTLITEISKANDKLSKTDLEKISNNSFDVASKYGKNATDYLSGVQEASRAGYENAEGMAELSVAAQGAGDMTAELANQYLIATDKAYKMEGSVEKLTEVLDGSNYITNHNAVNMTELAESMSIVGSTAASFGVDVDEATAALGTMIATTQQSGSEVARAFKAILLNIRQVSDEEEGIDAEGLTKYENACNALNVKLKETKNGVLSLRDPMEVLRDLSTEYNKLKDTDIRRTGLLSSVGGKLRATQLDALLRQWDTYEEMLKQYADGTNSMAAEAEKTANSWEGSLNRIGNTWKDTVANVANSDAIITAINNLNNLLSIINNVTDKLGSLGTIGIGAGIFAGIKNVGSPKMFGLINCFEYTDSMLVLLDTVV